MLIPRDRPVPSDSWVISVVSAAYTPEALKRYAPDAFISQVAGGPPRRLMGKRMLLFCADRFLVALMTESRDFDAGAACTAPPGIATLSRPATSATLMRFMR
ncbi:hypothetical protein HDA43_005064 [Streptosporangium sandarakinum]|uniref:Uncharacterized protein n=1 Tax=Streptosporangium sandarakinum TaxID=1260955 RepID=A0A852V6C9_9ACTN|nr:hypothetical protein [Streptosporangium sandarakinum]